MNKLLQVPNSIMTSSGKYFNFIDTKPDMFDIEDIAHSLSMQCRFGGHIPRFYSIAQHSVLCSQIIEPEHALSALLHDASEAYLMDIPTPLKNLLPEYKTMEDRLMVVAANKYGFEYPLNKSVKTVDSKMLNIEFNGVMLGNENFDCWTQPQAKEIFLETYNKLKG